MTNRGQMRLVDVVCCCPRQRSNGHGGQQDANPQMGRQNQVIRLDSLRYSLTSSEDILMESLRRYARTPVRDLYKEYNTLLNAYHQLWREYPTNERVKRSVPRYLEVMQDDVQLVFDWMTGVQSYKNRDIIRMNQRTAAFKEALDYVRKKLQQEQLEADNQQNENSENSELQPVASRVTSTGSRDVAPPSAVASHLANNVNNSAALASQPHRHSVPDHPSTQSQTERRTNARSQSVSDQMLGIRPTNTVSHEKFQHQPPGSATSKRKVK